MRALLLLVLLALFPIAQVHAQDMSQCNTPSVSGAWCPDEAAASAAALAGVQAYLDQDQHICGPYKFGPLWAGGIDFFRIRYTVKWNTQSCDEPGGIFSRDRDWPMGFSCKDRPAITTGFTPPNSSVGCNAGCTVVYSYNGDGTSNGSFANSHVCDIKSLQDECALSSGYYWHPTLNVCTPVQPPDCKPGQTPKEGVCKPPEQCPAGMITDENGLCKNKDPECPAGGIKGPDGSCVDDKNSCKAGTAKKSDGTCGKDENNDGKADDEDDDPGNDTEENEFSGGDDCKTPPQCAGDPIMCGQARIQWRIDCNTRRNVNVRGGGCNDPPQCTGDHCGALEVAQLVQQWRTACAVESLKTVPGGGNGEQPEWTKVGGMSQDPGQGSQPGDEPHVETITTSLSNLDQSGLGGGGTCAPLMPGGGGQLSSAFAQNLASPPPVFCDFIALIKAIVILSASVACAYILAKG